MNKRVLVIDDEIARIDDSQIFCNRFALRGYEYLFAKNERRAYSELENNDISLILLDIIFKGVGDRHGIQILKELSEKYSEIPVVMLSSRTDPETLVQCWDLGAKSYIIKWPSIEELQNKLNKYSRYIPKEQLIGNSPSMRRLKEKIGTIAKNDATVLIQGETGTGKGLIAKMIHDASHRRDSPFKLIDCTTLPGHLLESELFGHERGAFTDAKELKKGLVEAADAGTIFLDEIGEIDIGLQAKLLRFLEEHSFRRLGGTKNLSVDVRIVAATNKNLQSEVEAGRFRKDLYYRLNVCSLQTPPLRECKEDIPQLAYHVLKKLENEHRKGVVGFSHDVINLFQKHDWPGNVRELENVIAQAYYLSRGEEITLADVPDNLKGTKLTLLGGAIEIHEGFNLDQYTDRISWPILKQVYTEEIVKGKQGVQRRVAERVGLHPVNGFGRKIKQIKENCPELHEEIDSFLTNETHR